MWTGKKVVVVGIGKSGQAAITLLHRLGAEVWATDFSAEYPCSFNELPVQLELGSHSESFLKGAEALVVSPGVPSDAFPLKWARGNHVPILSELELGLAHIACPVIAVTGSNGKSTTTTLIAEFLKAEGKKAVACGNIGIPVCDMVGKKVDYLVVEVSSFQLEETHYLKPFISVLTNLSFNHLDRYASFDDYVQTKLKIFNNQPEWTIYRQEDLSLISSIHPSSKKISFSLKRPSLPFGSMVHSGKLCFQWENREYHICDTAEILLPGEHNLENILAAVNVAWICGIGFNAIAEVLKKFQGLEHRIEKVASISDILFVNDSKATSPAAVYSALSVFDSVIWIAGGEDKNGDFSSLLEVVKSKVKKSLFYGQSKEKLNRLFPNSIQASDLEEATQKAFRCAQKGDVILLSPGCASYDMFLNYMERGQRFKQFVHQLSV